MLRSYREFTGLTLVISICENSSIFQNPSQTHSKCMSKLANRIAYFGHMIILDTWGEVYWSCLSIQSLDWIKIIHLTLNRPFPFQVKFWSRQAWTKISSQLERASQN
jgi:hypothetical protein